jgi:UDP-N-acetylmuramoylalanine--D-glutamate ligase
VHLAGNIRGIATLPLLETVTADDTVVAELSSWQLQGFGESKRSPHIAVFTNFFADHLNYYGGSMEAYFTDKAQIFAHQTADDVLIMSPQAHEAMQTYWKETPRGRLVIAEPDACAKLTGELRIPGAHNVQNAVLAIAVARELAIPDAVTVEALRTFRGAPGRLEKVPCAGPYDVYNDATSTTPDALRVALDTLSPLATARGGRLILICGGTSKELVLDSLTALFATHKPVVITIPGTGTDALLPVLAVSGVSATQTASLPDAVAHARALLTPNDVLVFSPGFASFGEFKNEFDRNDTFLRLVAEQLGA